MPRLALLALLLAAAAQAQTIVWDKYDPMAVRTNRTADVVLEDPSVSRRHALVVRREGRTVVLDDRSLNGVVLNGERVSEAPLSHGDEIVLGRIAVQYVEVAG